MAVIIHGYRAEVEFRNHLRRKSVLTISFAKQHGGYLAMHSNIMLGIFCKRVKLEIETKPRTGVVLIVWRMAEREKVQ